MSSSFNDGFVRDLEKQMGDNLEKAAIFFAARVKEEINRSQPYTREVTDSGIKYRGEEPSVAGEPPKKVTGFLQRSIAYEMSADRKHAFVGTNLPYGYYLEIGTAKMGARPYLRATLIKHQDKLARIVEGK